MDFIDQKHKEFYENLLKQIEEFRKTDAYYRSFIYTLGISQVTREHFSEIFDISKKEINIDSLSANWQTATSKKVTELAFNLWNDFKYESSEDIEKNRISSDYHVSNIFSCSYAPYFYEAVKLRFPEYTKIENETENQNEEDM